MPNSTRRVRRIFDLVPALAASLFLAMPAAASLVVDIDARLNATTTDGDLDDPSAVAVTLALGAGTWRVDPVGPGQGGAFTAWNAWGGDVTGCDGMGARCTRGWMHWYRIQADAFARMRLEDGILYATAAAALANGVAVEFTLATAQDVHFFVFDTGPLDNVGGVSLRVAAVPEPAAMLVFAASLAGLAMSRRRRRGPLG